MNGGGGGYNRPSGGSGSGEDDTDEEGPSSVPAPDSDLDEESGDPQIDEQDGGSEESDEDLEDAPGSPPTTGGVGGNGGIPPADPGTGDTGDNNNPAEESEENGQEPTEEPSENREQEDRNQDDVGDDEEDESEEDSKEDDEEEEDDDEENEECLLTESAQLHSPNPAALDAVTEGEIYSVQLREQSVCVVNENGQTVGSIAEPWVDTIKNCLSEGWPYRARILELDGGYCEVRVTNKCLLSQQINLKSINSAITSKLYSGHILPVEKTDQSEIIVTTDESRVGTVPDPWASLLSDCITQGQSYQAEVVDVMPDHCQVIIQNGPIDE